MRKIAFIVLLLCFGFATYAQSKEKNKQNVDVLVYIMPDSLELPSMLKRGAMVKEAVVKSKQLSSILSTINTKSIAKAFPNWNEADSIAYTADGKRIKKPEFHRIFTLSFASEEEASKAIEKLNQIQGVLYAENEAVYTDYNDPRYLDGTQWYLKNNGRNWGIPGADINAEAAWSIFTGSSNIKIGIVDRGVELNHDEFSGKASGDLPTINNHGTNVAGIAAAKANNSKGGRGVDWNARILSYNRVHSNGASIAPEQITKAVNEGAYVINCSWGGPDYNMTLASAVAYANKMNRTTVAAMGNEGTQLVNYPAALSSVIAVGATDNNDNITSFSTTGNHIDVTAPGQDIFTTTTNNGYAVVSGTSFAAPQVTGLASLLKGYSPNLSNDDIRQIIRLSTDKVGNTPYLNGFNDQMGYGRINAGRALSFLKAPYELVQATATGGTAVSTSGSYVHQFMGASGLATGNYLVKRIEVQKTIPLPSTIYNISGLWGRGVHTTGWRASSPNFGEGFCEVVPGSLTGTNVTLRTYVYEVYSIIGQYYGYHPAAPSKVTFAYSILGLEKPSISGPSTICDQATYTINNLPEGAAVQWSASNNCLTLIAGQGTPSALFKGNGNDYCNVNATITIGGQSLPLQPLRIWCGTPVINNISGTQHFPLGGTGVYMAEVWGSDDTTLEWSVYPSLPVWFSGNHAYVTFPSTNGDYRITLTATNSCGSVESYHFASTGEYEPFRINPNPARNFVTVELQDDRTTNAYSASTAYEIQLWSATSLLRKFATDQDTYQFSVANLPRGIYFVRVVKDGKTHTQKLIKN